MDCCQGKRRYWSATTGAVQKVTIVEYILKRSGVGVEFEQNTPEKLVLHTTPICCAFGQSARVIKHVFFGIPPLRSKADRTGRGFTFRTAPTNTEGI